MGREGTNTMVEFMAFWGLLFFTSNKNVLSLHVVGASRVIVDWVDRKAKLQVSLLAQWKSIIDNLKENFYFISFKHVYMQFNTSIDSLSKNSIGHEEGHIYFEVYMKQRVT